MGGHSSKLSTIYYLGLTVEQQVQALEVWSRIKNNLSLHNEKIMERFFHMNPEYLKYFATACNCPSTQVLTHPRVISHWQLVLDIIGFVTTNLNTKKKEIDGKFVFIALIHKDMQLEPNDFERYTNVFITYLNNDVLYLSPTIESNWTTLLNTIFKIIYDKMKRMRKFEEKSLIDGHDLCFTPKMLGLNMAEDKKQKCFANCRGYSTDTTPDVKPSQFNYDNEQFWINHKEAWVHNIKYFRDHASIAKSDDDILALKKILPLERDTQLSTMISIEEESSAGSETLKTYCYNVTEEIKPERAASALQSVVMDDEIEDFHTKRALCLLQKAAQRTNLSIENTPEMDGKPGSINLKKPESTPFRRSSNVNSHSVELQYLNETKIEDRKFSNLRSSGSSSTQEENINSSVNTQARRRRRIKKSLQGSVVYKTST